MFKKAEKKQVKLKLGLTGPSGSGKTYSALKIAQGLGGRIAVIDTENGSASLYSDLFEFDVCEIKPPYSTDRYIEAMKNAERSSYDIVIIDSITQQWAGEGGILARKEQLDSRGGNSFTNWSKFTPEHERFKAALLHLNAHTICTIRSKQDYHMGQSDKGKMTPQKVGLAPVQREGVEYELSVVFDLTMDHMAKASKDRTTLYEDRIFKITEDTGKELSQWLGSGKPEEPQAGPSREDLNKKLMSVHKPYISLFPQTDFKSLLMERYGVAETRLIDLNQLQDLIEYMSKKLDVS